MDIKVLMKQIHDWLVDILKDNYVGVYFHGSLRLGSFHPHKSDLDFIIVVKEKMDAKTKERIWDKLLEHVGLFPEKGFEFSVVLAENCSRIKHPVAYELHGSRDWIERYRRDKSTVINDDWKVDPDLASHFRVIRVPNDALDFGRPSREVFAEVPREYVIDSNYQDTLECAENIIKNPLYCVLNLCRFCALLREDLILSKYDGGKWALENLHTEYPDVIKLAMEDYRSDTDAVYDSERLKGFAKEAIEFISASCMRRENRLVEQTR